MVSSARDLTTQPTTPLTHSQALWTKIALAEGRLHAASDRFWTHAALRELFPEFLVQLYHVVRGGLELMSFAAARAAAMPYDSSAVRTAAYLTQHIEEEQDHAGWLLRDLAVLGIGETQVLSTEPLPALLSLIGTQYYWIAAAHPASLFGYLVVLEGSPPLLEQLDDIERSTGLPRDAFRCLRSHAEDDPAHLAELNATLDSLPLTKEQERRIALSAFHTIDHVASLLDALLARHARAQGHHRA